MSASRRIIAPYIGEFGWEVMNWQGRVRQLLEVGDFTQVLIVAPPDRRAFYRDCLVDNPRIVFCPCRPLELPGHANEDHRIDANGNAIDRATLTLMLRRFTERACQQNGISATDAEFVMPPMDGTLLPTRRPYQSFVSLEQPEPKQIDVLLIPRNRRVATERNQPDGWWDRLEAILIELGLSVAVLQPRLDIAIQQLSAARLAVGASTGGLHLASLCKCPHYVWGPGDDERWTAQRVSNRQRYETIWNPLGTAVRYDALGWQPSVESVVAGVVASLERLGPKTTFARDADRVDRWRWRARRGLAQLIEPNSGATHIPWRVKEFTRMNLL